MPVAAPYCDGLSWDRWNLDRCRALGDVPGWIEALATVGALIAAIVAVRATSAGASGLDVRVDRHIRGLMVEIGSGQSLADPTTPAVRTCQPDPPMPLPSFVFGIGGVG
jgi:hypothetical protein